MAYIQIMFGIVPDFHCFMSALVHTVQQVQDFSLLMCHLLLLVQCINYSIRDEKTLRS